MHSIVYKKELLQVYSLIYSPQIFAPESHGSPPLLDVPFIWPSSLEPTEGSNLKEPYSP